MKFRKISFSVSFLQSFTLKKSGGMGGEIPQFRTKRCTQKLDKLTYSHILIEWR